MDATGLRHLLTADERGAFERHGYLAIPSALDGAQVEALLTVARRHDDEFRSTAASEHAILNLHDLVGRDPEFLELVDLPTTFPKVWGVLGWHIALFHTQLIVTPPTHPAAPRGGYAWHQDNNRMNLDFETPPPHPRVSVKVGYFLTDVPEPGMGNFCVVPGSHLLGRPRFALHEQPPGAVEVTARAGDAVLFDRRLWHAASTNKSEATRVLLTYGYAYRWVRPKSAMDLAHLYPSLDPVRRQLLGASTDANAYFDPTDADVPLRAWIREHAGGAAVAP